MLKRYILCLIIMLLCTVNLSAQSRRRRSGSNSSTSNVTDIRQVDFKNFTYQIEGKRIRLQNGEYNGREHWRFDRNFQTRRDHIAYGDLTGDGKEEAVIVLAHNIADTNTILQYGYIYTIKNGQIAKLADFQGGDGGCSMEGEECILINVKIEDGILIVDRAVPTADDSRCCPSMYRSTKYRYDSSRLIEIGKTSLKRMPAD